MSGRAELARITAITRRDWLIERSYRLRYVFQVFRLAVVGVIMFHVSKAFVLNREVVFGLRGAFFDFALTGVAVMTIASLGVGTFNQNILREQSLGTLEVLFATPTPVAVLLAGSFVFPLILTVVELTLYLGVGIGVFGAGLTVGGVLLAIPLIALTLVTFCAFGIVSASLVVLIKRGDPLSTPLLQATSVLGGALFPVTVLPTALEVLARGFPAYYAINGLREALLGTGALSDVGPDLLVLAGFAVVLLPLSLLIFDKALDAARRSGTLANY
jgi:ABC-2 type transport system permease protein